MTSRIALFTLGFAGLLIAAAAAIPFAIGAAQYDAVSRLMVTHQLDAAQAAQKFMQEQQALHQEALSQSVATNANFVGYIAQALASVDASGKEADVASIRDLLDERRRDTALAAAAIFDTKGRLVAATGDNVFTRNNDALKVLIDRAVKGLVQVSAVFDDDAHVPLVTATPLVRGTDVAAVLLTAQPFGERALRDMARVAKTELAIVETDAQGPHLVVSTLAGDDTQMLAEHVKTLDFSAFSAADKSAAAAIVLPLGNHAANARIEPLLLANGKAFLISVAPHAAAEELKQAIASPLTVAAAIVCVLCLIALALYWRRLLGPLAVLDELFARATKGDHALEYRGGGNSLAGRLGAGFNHLQQLLQRHRLAPGTPRRRATDNR